MLHAITRAVSPSINECELTYLDREPIDAERAEAQHHKYEELLAEAGARVISLPAEPGLPDSVFVEDPVVVVDEVAIINRMGVESRRAESELMAKALRPYRRLFRMQEPGTLEGGDVLRIGKRIFVGHSPRTNAAGIAQLTAALTPFGYTVEAVELRGCMHLKSGCSALAGGVILAHRLWLDERAFEGFRIVEVSPKEPRAANVLRVGEFVIMPEGFPETRRIIEREGYKVRTVDVSELLKAESGVTCSSVLFEA